LKKEFVDSQERKSALESSIFHITRVNGFLGSTLQMLNIQYNHLLPTAGIMFNNELKRWDMHINPYYFCKKLNHKQRQAVLFHEIMHILHKHPLRVAFTRMPPRKRHIMNIAMDMAINQFIKDLPAGCNQCPPPAERTMKPCPNEMCPGHAIFVDDFYDQDKAGKKTPWPHNQTAEQYYERLILRFEEPDDEEEGDGDGDGSSGQGQSGGGQGQSSGDDGSGGQQGKGNAGGGANSQDLPDTLDTHHWDGSGEEKDQLEATEDLIKRAMVKSNFGFDKLPDFVKETMEYIEGRKAELNYKKLILLAMKASLPANRRVHSWTRKSRRFGFKAPGRKTGTEPKLEFFIDTSGSISIEEANEFLDIVDEFLKVGATECRMNLFHTRNYYSEDYKLGKRLEKSDFENGCTDLEDSMRRVAEVRPDLTIFLTDGYYDNVKVEEWLGNNQKFPTCLFIISRNGTEKHPLKRLGTTIKIPDPSGRN
jgi:predicted metal-dependent peptidase